MQPGLHAGHLRRYEAHRALVRSLPQGLILHDLFAQLSSIANSHPAPGEDWQARYQPFVQQVLRLRARPNARWSFVVVAWRADHALLGCLDRILRQDGLEREDIQLIVVDNGELTVSQRALTARADVLITMQLNVGCSTGRNVGAAYATAPLLSFIDDDGLIGRDYAACAARYFDDPAICALRGRVIPKAHPYFNTLAGHYDRGPQPIEECLTAEGTIAIRRTVYMEAGGFPEGMVGHEGLHLSFNILRAHPDAKILYAPDVTLAHDYMQSWKHFYKKSMRYAEINNRAAVRDPALAAFLQQQLSRKFPRPVHPIDHKAARVVLLALRKTLVRVAPVIRRLQGASIP